MNSRETESAIAEIWCEVLEIPEVGVQDNFFDLGGHSVLLHLVRDRILEQFGKDIPLVELFTHPTVRALARHLDGETSGEPPADGRRPAARAKGRTRLARRRTQRVQAGEAGAPESAGHGQSRGEEGE